MKCQADWRSCQSADAQVYECNIADLTQELTLQRLGQLVLQAFPVTTAGAAGFPCDHLERSRGLEVTTCGHNSLEEQVTLLLEHQAVHTRL